MKSWLKGISIVLMLQGAILFLPLYLSRDIIFQMILILGGAAE